MRYAFRTVSGIPAVPSVSFSATLFDRPKPARVSAKASSGGDGCSLSDEYSIGWGDPPNASRSGTYNFAQAGFEIRGGVIEPVPSGSIVEVVTRWQPIAYDFYLAADQTPPTVIVDELGVLLARLNSPLFASSPWDLSRGVFKMRVMIDGVFARNTLTISVGPGEPYSQVAWTVDLS